jgi:hypothetical protein
MNAETPLTDILWQHAKDDLYCTKADFITGLAGWEISSVEINGELAFIFAQRGAQFHFQSLTKGGRISMSMIREHLQPIIDEYGYAETRTPHEDKRQHRFNRLFGFEVVGRDDYDVHYRIERLPRSASCPS